MKVYIRATGAVGAETGENGIASELPTNKYPLDLLESLLYYYYGISQGLQLLRDLPLMFFLSPWSFGPRKFTLDAGFWFAP